MYSISRCRPLLGTYVEIVLASAEESEDTLIDMSMAAYAEVEKIEKLMSFHDPESELSYINRHAYEKACDISAATQEVLLKAVEISQLSQGQFDISIAPHLIEQKLLPGVSADIDTSASWKDLKINKGKVSFARRMLLDLGGIAKGYAVDKAMSIFNKNVDVVINAGGDLKMNCWQDKSVFIKKPNRHRGESIQVPMQAAALATSANYYLQGKSAIISPDTKQAVNDARSYSVFAPECMLADALTKVALLCENNADVIKSMGAKLLVLNGKD